MSNRDLLDYLQAVQNSIDRSKKYIDEAKSEPMIQVNNITVNNDSSGLDRESKERVINAVKALIGNLQNQQDLPPVEVVEEDIDLEENEEE